ncbi:MAG: MFS transporter [Erysipelotrichaceae bacterium]|nr:MFS transporter [Erysipelotrichaceae bacterium]
MKSLSIYKGVFTQTQYMKLIVANMINRFGDSIDMIAFSWMAYQISGSTTWMAIVFAFNALPSILFMPFAGAWVESMNKKLAMIITDVGRGILVVMIAFLYINQMLTPVMLVITTLLISTLEAFRIPAGMAIIPIVLDKEHYNTGLSLNATVRQVSMVIGMALAGGIIALIGVFGAMMINALTFFLSSFLISLMHVPHESTSRKESTLYLIKEGFEYLKNTHIIFILCLFGMGMNFLFSPFGVLQTPYIVDVLKLDAVALSLLGVTNIAGMALGSFLFPHVSLKLSRQKILGLSGIGIGCGFISFTLLHSGLNTSFLLIALAIISSLFGLMVGFLQTSISVSFMTHVDKTYLARAGSIFNALVSGSVPISSFLLSGITFLLDIPQIMILYGILSIGLFVIITMNRKLATL